MSELIFELYGAPSLMFGVDSLFSLFYNQPDIGYAITSISTDVIDLEDDGHALVLSAGHHASFILPVVAGQWIPHHTRRSQIHLL